MPVRKHYFMAILNLLITFVFQLDLGCMCMKVQFVQGSEDYTKTFKQMRSEEPSMLTIRTKENRQGGNHRREESATGAQGGPGQAGKDSKLCAAHH